MYTAIINLDINGRSKIKIKNKRRFLHYVRIASPNELSLYFGENNERTKTRDNYKWCSKAREYAQRRVQYLL